MKRRKTAILLALCLGITTSFTACGNTTAASAQPTSDKAQTDTAADQAEAATADAQAEAADLTASADAAADQAPADSADQAQVTVAVGQTSGDPLNQAAAPQPAAVQPTPDKFHIELEEIGRVGNKDDYRVFFSSLLHKEDGNYTFCDFKGNVVDERPLLNMDYLGWGLYSVTVEIEGEVNSTGLVDVEGDVLIPFNAAIIRFPREYSETERPRYVLVFTGTEQTENEDEALFYATDRMFAISAQDGDVFYKGTLSVFDLETRQFINGLEFTQGSYYNFAQVGGNLLADLDQKAVVYSPDGKTLYTEQGSLYYNHKYLTDRIDGSTVIIDANGSPLYTTADVIMPLGYESDYFLLYNDGKYTAVDCTGASVLNGQWSYIYGESKGRFCVKNEGDDIYTLVAPDNSVITTCSRMFDGESLGFLCFDEDDNYTVITPGGRVIEGLESDSEKLVFTKDDYTSYLILNTGEFISVGDNELEEVTKGVIAVTNYDDYTTGLVDAFTGRELISPEYEEVDYINDDYLYLEDGDDIVIYKPVIVPEP